MKYKEDYIKIEIIYNTPYLYILEGRNLLNKGGSSLTDVWYFLM